MMTDLPSLLAEIREVGENVYSNSQDLFLLSNLKFSDDQEEVTKIRHGLVIVDNILTILTYLSTLDLEILDEREELIVEVNKIKFSCQLLQKTFNKILENGKQALITDKKYFFKLLTTIKNSAGKMITLSYHHEKPYSESNKIDICTEESENVCYNDIQTCEKYCPNGFCIEDDARISNVKDSNCPEYVETFTQSSFIEIENGFDNKEPMPWHSNKEPSHFNFVKENKGYTIWDVLGIKLSKKVLEKSELETNILETKEETTSSHFSESIMSESTETISDYFHEPSTIDVAKATSEDTTDDDCVTTENSFKDPYTTDTTTQETTPDGYEISSNSLQESYMTETLETSTQETTKYSYETPTNSYIDSYTTESPTTPHYETTTQDMYKLSQDIYQAAQDLSTKSSEISSMSSEISSKSSDISSLVNELNNYEDDELSKKIQGVSKLTQEINSKTSEISSLTSTMSSLTSDISSASSDITSADRHHAFRTTPWQKMSSKCDDVITSAQGIVTAAQDILVKITEVVVASADLKVANSVANMAGQMTAKTQRLISESLSIVNKVIDLMNVIDSC